MGKNGAYNKRCYTGYIYGGKTHFDNVSILQVDKVLKLACLRIMGEMQATLTAAKKPLLNLRPLHLVIQGEARMGMYKLQFKTGDSKNKMGYMAITKFVGGGEQY